MENAKDTFYVMLQSRLAALNPARTIVLRGTVRPGILVVENELPTASVAADAFRMHWIGQRVDGAAPMPIVSMQCEIRYATDGNADNAGLDRGRLLTAMDAELAAALWAEPRSIGKSNFSNATAGTGPAAMGTKVFWGDPAFGASSVKDERLERSVSVEVFAYQEEGEL